MITEKGIVFSIEADRVMVDATIEGETTQVEVPAIGVQIVLASGQTVKITTREAPTFAVGDSVIVSVA